MADKKSVLEEALLEAQQLEEAVKSNAKEILASTMKQEIEELVKESLNEEETDDLVAVDTEVVDDFDDDEEYEDQEEEGIMFPDEEEEEAMVSIDMDADGPALDLTQASDDEVLKVFKSMGAEDGIVVTQDGDTIDIEDQEAGTEYKIELAESKLRNNLLINEDYDKNDSMKEEYDDIQDIDEMKRDFYEEDLNIQDLEEMEKTMSLPGDEETSEGHYGKKHMGETKDDEPTYEISLEEEDLDIQDLEEMMVKKMEEGHHEEMREMGDYGFKHHKGHSKQGYLPREDDMLGAEHGHEDSRFSLKDRARMARGTRKYDMDMPEGEHSEEEVGEASRTYGFGSKSGRGLRKAFTPNRNYEYPMNESSSRKINQILEAAKKLESENRHYREKNKEYRQALKVFRNKLNEIAVFNANLAYSTKLFTEHTTTKKEKVNILRRFDNVTTLNESKNLFKSLNSELNSKVNKLNESVQKTITKTPSGGSSVNLIESKTYESPQITRMREIMGKL